MGKALSGELSCLCDRSCCRKPLSKSCFCGCSIFPHKLGQRLKSLCSRFCRKLQCMTFICCLQIQGICTLRHENSLSINKYWTIFKPVLSEYRYKITKISHVILCLDKETWGILHVLLNYFVAFSHILPRWKAEWVVMSPFRQYSDTRQRQIFQTKVYRGVL